MTELAPRNHNNPPDPIDQINAQFEAARTEAANWLDGSPVENEAQMNAVDTLRKSMRDCRLALEAGQKSATAPLYDVYKAELARWKPEIDDAKRIEAGLVATVDAFKRKLAEVKEAARKEAERLAWEETRKAQEAARLAAVNDLEAQREAAEAQARAEAAQAAASRAKADAVKGLRTVTRYEVTDHRALLHWIAKHDREAVTAFINAWAAKHHKEQQGADGLRVWTDKEAF